MPRPPAVAGTPVASVKTTPLTMRGVAGAARSCETHPGSSARRRRCHSASSPDTAPVAIGPFVDGIPLASLPATGTRIHVAPPAVVVCAGCAVGAGSARAADGVECHAASASALTTAPVPSTVFDACNGVPWSATAKRLRVEQPHAAIFRCRCDDLPVAVPEDRRSGHELGGRLREPVLHLQRLGIERDDRVRLAVAGGPARPDGGDQRAVRA